MPASAITLPETFDPPPGSRALVVDDDPDFRQLVTLRLSRAGYDVTSREDGSTGLAAALAGQFDVVVLDWIMPGLTGIEVVRILRENPGTEQTPILLLTGLGPAEAESGLAAGADDCLAKPFRSVELLSRVGSLVNRTPAKVLDVAGSLR